MSRNRIIYQSEALFTSVHATGDSAGTIPATSVFHLKRVTEVSNNAEIARQNVNVFGKLAALSREVIEEPTVSMDFKYYLADGYNEKALGFVTNGLVSCSSGILANAPEAQRNFYVLTVDEGEDADGVNIASVAGKAVIGVGNAFITNYTVNGAVGEIPTASVSIEASNITFAPLGDTNGFQNPAVNVSAAGSPQYEGLVLLPVATETGLSVQVLRPGDIVMDFGTGSLQMGGAVLDGMTSASTKQSAHIQSFSLELPFSRTPQKKLGSAFAFSRELEVPIDVTLNVSANLGDIDEGSLRDLICATSESRNVTIKMYEPCDNDGTAKEPNLIFTLKGCSMDSQNMASTIGDSKTVELKFMSQIGGANDTDKGLFISGQF